MRPLYSYTRTGCPYTIQELECPEAGSKKDVLVVIWYDGRLSVHLGVKMSAIIA